MARPAAFRTGPKKSRARNRARLITICNLRRGDYFAFFAILPAPPHFVQLLPALAFSTQHACAHVLPSAAALVQQPAIFDSDDFSAAANITLAENSEATARASNEFENFFIYVLGVVDLVRAAGVEPAEGNSPRTDFLPLTHVLRGTNPPEVLFMSMQTSAPSGTICKNFDNIVATVN